MDTTSEKEWTEWTEWTASQRNHLPVVYIRDSSEYRFSVDSHSLYFARLSDFCSDSGFWKRRRFHRTSLSDPYYKADVVLVFIQRLHDTLCILGSLIIDAWNYIWYGIEQKSGYHSESFFMSILSISSTMSIKSTTSASSTPLLLTSRKTSYNISPLR